MRAPRKSEKLTKSGWLSDEIHNGNSRYEGKSFNVERFLKMF